MTQTEGLEIAQSTLMTVNDFFREQGVLMLLFKFQFQFESGLVSIFSIDF